MLAGRKDLTAGAFFVLVGLLYGATALWTMPIGTAAVMGPGYVPLVLSLGLIGLGGAIAFRSLRNERRAPQGVVAWRALLFLSLSIYVFAQFIGALGLLPGVFATALLATLASPKISITRTIVVSAGLAVFCTVVFSYGLGLPTPVLGYWFDW